MIKKIFKKFLKSIGENINQTNSSDSLLNRYKNEYTEEAFQHFKRHFNKSLIFENEFDIRKYAIEESIKLNINNKKDLYLEFGVFKGTTINFFANILRKENLNIYGFDSFYGLTENWTGTHHIKNIAFNRSGKIPKTLKNVIITKGEIEDTLNNFINENLENSNINFIHLDFDTYTPTAYVLKNIKKYIKKDTIILFDEIYGFPSWKEHEYKALIENFNENEYVYLAFSEKQAVIRITKDFN